MPLLRIGDDFLERQILVLVGSVREPKQRRRRDGGLRLDALTVNYFNETNYLGFCVPNPLAGGREKSEGGKILLNFDKFYP